MDRRIQSAINGDSVALGELFFEYHDRLARTLSLKIPHDLQSTIAPEDILHDAYIDAFRGIGRFEPKSDRSFYRWLEAIAEHRMIDAIRALRTKKRGGQRRRASTDNSPQAESVADLFDVIRSELPTPSRNVAREEGVAAVLVRIGELPPEHREVVQLYHLDGRDLDDIARQLGKTSDAVRGLLYRARKNLRDAMGQSSLWLSKR